MLFGDDSVAPLLALITNRSIAFDIVDTNNQVFISSLVDLSQIFDTLKGNDLIFIVRSAQGISSLRETRDFLSKNCDFLASFHDKLEKDYVVYKSK